jgi:hypothetical protein
VAQGKVVRAKTGSRAFREARPRSNFDTTESVQGRTLIPTSSSHIHTKKFQDTHRISRAPRIAYSQLASLPSGIVVDAWRRIRSRGLAGGDDVRVVLRVSMFSRANLPAHCLLWQ